MIQSTAYDTDQKYIVKTASDRFFDGKDRVGIILFTGQNDRLHIKMRLFMRIKVADDQAWLHLQTLQVFQTTVAENHIVIGTEPFPEETVIVDIGTAYDNAASIHFVHHRLPPFVWIPYFLLYFRSSAVKYFFSGL